MTSTITDHADSDPFDRDRYDRPLIPHPETGELLPYMRVSRYAGTLTEKFLGTWHQWWAVKAAFLFPEQAAKIAEAPSQKGQKAALDAMLDAAGMNLKRDRGSARHNRVRQALTGSPMPDLTDEQAAQLAVVVDAVRSLGTIDAVEVPCVNDAWRLAGQCDYLGTTADGQPFIADLKTGSFVKGSSPIEWGLQLIAYARSQQWDRATQQRLGWLCPTMPRLHIVHAPQDNPDLVDIYTLDPPTCMILANAANTVLEARRLDPTA